METTFYKLESSDGPRWTTAQEKLVSLDYPFVLHDETVEQFVTRTYLQFLWLPQSIMPLQLLVPSLRRVAHPAESCHSPHPLHPLLDSLLQTTRAITKKYHVELVQILQDGGGAGEIEETMMWYALHNKKTEEQQLSNKIGAGNHALWMDANWRQEWLESLEKREVQIQILLYLIRLSLPGAAPESTSQGKKRRHSRKGAHVPSATPEEKLEGFMDKLSMLQLTSNLADNKPKLSRNEKDWAQSFCEDIVETTFKPLLPDLCSLLRSKVFPNSPFSDTDTVTSSRTPSPEPDFSQTNMDERMPAQTTSTTSQVGSHSLARTRSRSLSMSLAQERKERERSVSIGPGKKRLLNREVSMSRAFKPKNKAPTRTAENSADSQSKTNGKPQAEKDEVILVEDTPQKPRAANRKASQSQLDPISSSHNVRHSIQGLFGSGTNNMDDDDDAWMLDSSPDVLLLQPGRKGAGTSDDDYEVTTFHTPCKKPRRRE